LQIPRTTNFLKGMRILFSPDYEGLKHYALKYAPHSSAHMKLHRNDNIGIYSVMMYTPAATLP
jgi:hypothetical protein